QVETVLEFYGDAVGTRTNPRLGAILRGLDAIAGDSLDMILRRLDIDAPPAVVYLDKGLGPSTLRSHARLWDPPPLAPAAALTLLRHTLAHQPHPGHHAGSQGPHQTGWPAELADAPAQALTPRSRELAEAWHGWASEVAADVHAFVQAGWAPLPALANVVDGTAEAVYQLIPGDPHPIPLIRVLFNAALCRHWFGAGPWDDLAAAWAERHPPSHAPADAGAMARLSVAALDDIVRVCTRQPMAAFRDQPLCALADPRHVAPLALE